MTEATLDPRVQDNAENIKQLKEAVLALAAYLDGVVWRVTTEEEKKAGTDILSEIREKLEEKQK